MCATIGHSAATARGGDVLLLPRPQRRAPAAPSGRIRRAVPGRCLLTAIARSTCPSDMPVRSWRSGAGRTPGVRSSPWPTLRRAPGGGPQAGARSRSRRSRSRSCAASTPCSRSSGQSTARAPKSAGRSARSGASRWSRSFRFTCASSAPNSPAATILPRPSIISSSVGPPSPCSSMTDAPACRTMPPNARCVASRCDVHYTPLVQASGNIGSWFSDVTRHGLPVRPIAVVTRWSCKSSARIWYGAPGTTCSAGKMPSLTSRRMR